MLESDARSATWKRPGVAVALVVMALALIQLGQLSVGGPPEDTSSEAGFARDLIVHHGQAVEMAEIIRDRTTDPGLRILATDIALTQQAQIGRMQGWFDTWRLPPTGTEAAMAWMDMPVSGRMPGMASRDEVSLLTTAPIDQAEVAFLRLMIPHHQAAVAMAEAIIERTDRPEVSGFAQHIVDSQTAEIEVMAQMLSERSAQVPAALSLEHETGTHGEGFFGSLWPATLSALELLLIAGGVFALAWLVSVGMNGRRLRQAEPWSRIGAGALALSGLVHLGLVEEHFEESVLLGLGFAVSAVLALLIAGSLWANVRPWLLITGAGLSAALVVAYFGFRWVGFVEEPVDALGLILKVVEGAAVVVMLKANWLPRDRAKPEPELAPVT